MVPRKQGKSFQVIKNSNSNVDFCFLRILNVAFVRENPESQHVPAHKHSRAPTMNFLIRPLPDSGKSRFSYSHTFSNSNQYYRIQIKEKKRLLHPKLPEYVRDSTVYHRCIVLVVCLVRSIFTEEIS
jgi:hypothetical protein